MSGRARSRVALLIRVGIEFFVAALFAAEVSPEVSPSSPGQWNEIFFPAGEIRVGDGERSGGETPFHKY